MAERQREKQFTREDFVSRLRWLRSFDDRRPKEILDSTSGRNSMWRKGGFFGTIVNCLFLGLLRGFVPKDLKREVDAFIERYTSEEFAKQGLVNQRNVEEAKTLLDNLLARLEQQT